MRKVNIITAEQAAQLVKDNDTITSIGFVSSAHPEALTKALEKRFLETNTPQNLTYIYAGSQGIRDGRAAEHLAHTGLLKRAIIGHWQTVPAIGELAVNNKIEAYNFSQAPRFIASCLGRPQAWRLHRHRVGNFLGSPAARRQTERRNQGRLG